MQSSDSTVSAHQDCHLLCKNIKRTDNTNWRNVTWNNHL